MTSRRGIRAARRDVEEALAATLEAFLTWRTTPAPRRGELIRRLGELLRENKRDLADLITI
ncbi:hypothetical protein GCM10022233_56620 [Streptomyces shaanxiensis]|uniref:Aldehyde dehydrogenase domain-containing protein n=1 Tax=Streptomyces shaanxiensis TaxID=653357 RepID=A0ABP7VQA9_9ACTN